MQNVQNIKNLEVQFSEYVQGKRKKFNLSEIGLHSDLCELAGTDLQKAVWRELLNIPYGEIISYQELAKRVGKPKAVRAVASAVGDNPLCIVIPCHRVLPKSSVLKLLKIKKNPNSKNSNPKNPNFLVGVPVGGYSMGSDIKESLLELEVSHFHAF